ncbi:TetR/AcrR family transcriptional regulator [Bacteroidota bacterium]
MNKREQILQTTLELISENGFHGTSISHLIKKSNVAAGTIYHYFKSKEELIDTLYTELKEEMGTALIQNMDTVMNYKDKFIMMWKNLFTFYIENPKKYEYIEHYANSPLVRKEIKDITKNHYQPVIEFIESGVQLGILRNLPINVLLNIIFSNISTLVKMILLEEIESSDELLKDLIQSSWDSIKIN